jgi:uncharacterized membrane protein
MMTDQEIELDALPLLPQPRPKKLFCAITNKELPRKQLIELGSLRPSLADRIREDHPDLQDDAHIAINEAERYRTLYVEEMLKLEHGELTELDRQVAESLADHDTIVENIEEEFEETRTFGERVSDGLASFGGSWAFLISFFVVLIIWMAINVWLGEQNAFDAYPFILLNLVLSCIAAIQAPIIMMSQRRQETKDRLRAFNDYKVNLKAELEIRHIQEKLDYLLTKQWQRLSEMQQMQMELMQENLLQLRSKNQRKIVIKKKRSKKATNKKSAGTPVAIEPVEA